MERTPERRRRGIRHLPARQVSRHGPRRIRLRDGPQQRLGVRMLGIGVDRLGRTDLDDAAEIHDRDPVAEEARRREVVRDVEVRELEVALEREHQFEDLRADAHVKHRDRLVRDEQHRVENQRPRDHGPLLLSAG